MFKISIKLPATITSQEAALIGEGLSNEGQTFAALREENHHQNPWILEWFFEEKPDAASYQQSELKNRLAILCKLHDLVFDPGPIWALETLPDIDWLKESYRQLPPFSVGPFFIYSAHDANMAPKEQIPLQIEATTAFGSGQHGTTKGCLQAMLDLKGKGVCPWNILDMGTGSGILSIAAWKLWKAPVLAVDNDPESIAMTQRHLQENKIPSASGNISCLVNEGFAGSAVSDKGPYELIIANILSQPLIDMAPGLIKALDDNGYVILSGMLHEQAAGVKATYEALGLHIKNRYDIDDWSTLVMHKP